MPFIVLKRATNPDGSPAGDGNWFFAMRTHFATNDANANPGSDADAAVWIADPANARKRLEYTAVEVPA
jgi:hypothetical protein